MTTTIATRNYLNATHACPAMSVVDGVWDCWRMEPVRFIGMGQINGAPCYRYVTLVPCNGCETDMNGCTDGLRGAPFYTYAPLPVWGRPTHHVSTCECSKCVPHDDCCDCLLHA